MKHPACFLIENDLPSPEQKQVLRGEGVVDEFLKIRGGDQYSKLGLRNQPFRFPSDYQSPPSSPLRLISSFSDPRLVFDSTNSISSHIDPQEPEEEEEEEPSLESTREDLVEVIQDDLQISQVKLHHHQSTDSALSSSPSLPSPSSYSPDHQHHQTEVKPVVIIDPNQIGLAGSQFIEMIDQDWKQIVIEAEDHQTTFKVEPRMKMVGSNEKKKKKLTKKKNKKSPSTPKSSGLIHGDDIPGQEQQQQQRQLSHSSTTSTSTSDSSFTTSLRLSMGLSSQKPKKTNTSSAEGHQQETSMLNHPNKPSTPSLATRLARQFSGSFKIKNKPRLSDPTSSSPPVTSPPFTRLITLNNPPLCKKLVPKKSSDNLDNDYPSNRQNSPGRITDQPLVTSPVEATHPCPQHPLSKSHRSDCLPKLCPRTPNGLTKKILCLSTATEPENHPVKTGHPLTAKTSSACRSDPSTPATHGAFSPLSKKTGLKSKTTCHPLDLRPRIFRSVSTTQLFNRFQSSTSPHGMISDRADYFESGGQQLQTSFEVVNRSMFRMGSDHPPNPLQSSTPMSSPDAYTVSFQNFGIPTGSFTRPLTTLDDRADEEEDDDEEEEEVQGDLSIDSSRHLDSVWWTTPTSRSTSS